MATFGSELINLAASKKCDLMYDASVAGGMGQQFIMNMVLQQLLLEFRFVMSTLHIVSQHIKTLRLQLI